MVENISDISLNKILAARRDRAKKGLENSWFDINNHLPSDLGGDQLRSWGHELRQTSLKELEETLKSAKWFGIKL